MIGCSHTIRREYSISNLSGIPKENCHVEFYMEMPADNTTFEIVGRIKLGDSGFSMTCSEADALAILRKEACTLGADIVNITEESRPDFWSSCYRADAVFYRLKRPIATNWHVSGHREHS